jgi:serine O-acetyltransferase
MPITFLQTLRLIRSDFKIMSDYMGLNKSPAHLAFMTIMPSVVGLTLYRLSHWCYIKRLRPLAWLIWVINIYLTGADISPSASIGESCFLGHPVGSVITGKLGNRVIMYGAPLIGGGREQNDIGAGAGLPVIGNDVVIGIRSTILGPIHIGNNVTIGACSLVLRDVPDGTTVGMRPATFLKGSTPD